ncbi:hypothetical protein [Streptomyces sp. NPDC018031]|uniref:hypothetical protein n=1 Tax=Streptomyces sp. NPDC018031 TaxID=3365033 RepID=UPI0037B9580D
MTLFLLLLLIAIVLGLIGVAAESLGFLLAVGVLVFLLALVQLAVQLRRGGRRPLR